MRKVLLLMALLMPFWAQKTAVKAISKDTKLECPTPKSLMLHSAFGVDRMEELAQEIIEQGYITITYSRLYELWDQGKCAPPNAIVVSLDDLNSIWLRNDFVQMIEVFTSRGLVLTLGVITGSPDEQQNPKLWDYYKELDTMGVEIASHSSGHLKMSWIDDKEIHKQIVDSYDIICEHLEKCPQTFILPFGIGYDIPKVIEEATGKYLSLVSIAGPKTYHGDIFILKRIPPDNDSQQRTILLLEASFFSDQPEPVIQPTLKDRSNARRGRDWKVR
jgi:hypothetical protein